MKKFLMALVLSPIAFASDFALAETTLPTAPPVTEVNEGQGMDIQQRRRGRYRRRYRHCYGGYRRACNSIRTPIGVIRQCRNVWRPCARWGWRWGWGWHGAAETQAVSARAADFATKHQLDFDAAEILVSAFDEASNGNPALLKDLGLEGADHGRSPSSDTLRNLSEEFNVEKTTLEKALNDLAS